LRFREIVGHTLRWWRWGQQSTAGERISRVTSGTEATGRMIDDITLGVKATGSRTWITALFVDAGQIAGTLRIDGTFRTAVGRRSHIVG